MRKVFLVYKDFHFDSYAEKRKERTLKKLVLKRFIVKCYITK